MNLLYMDEPFHTGNTYTHVYNCKRIAHNYDEIVIVTNII